ncbi:MBL fold metallo-hydrolase [Dermatophilaceae bacterium Sec6.4]|nr:MBL fold metallo-hydrolase [Actinomycetota bacterium]
MSYDGAVSPGSPAQQRDLSDVVIRKLAVGPMHNNVYLVSCVSTGAAVLIDAAADWPAIAAMIGESNTRVQAIVTTHRHGDHTGALVEAVRELGAPTYAGDPDADALPVPVDVRLRDGDAVEVDGLTLSVALVRGHTPGSVVLTYDDPAGHPHVFTGDTLFPGGVGATDHFDYQSFPQLIDDVQERIFGRQNDAAWVYPGHGDDTTVGAERAGLPEWRARGW